MGLIALLSRFSPMIGDLTLDATISESHEMTAEVTDFPVEEGSDISDNRRIAPRVVTLDAVISSAPTSFAQIAGPLAPMSVPDGFKALEELFASDDLVTLVTKLRTYENMLITRLTVPRSNENGEAVFFSIELKQIQLVSTQRVQVVTLDPPKHAPKVKQGAKPPKQNVSVKQENLSVIQQINRAVGIVQ